MSNKPRNENIERFKVTKATFQDCLYYLNNCDIKGKDSEKMVQCKSLIKYMIQETSNSIETLKAGQDPQPSQPKVELTPDESGLAPHNPEGVK